MEAKDGKLTIPASLSNDELLSLAKKIANEIDEIHSVEIDDNIVESSALFALLGSIKKSNPNVKIPVLDDATVELNGIGKATFKRVNDE